MEIVWTNNALNSLDKNIDYLKKKWSYKDIDNFLQIVDEKITLLKQNPEIGTICEFKPTLRRLVITKHITLFYEIDTNNIFTSILVKL